MRLVHKISAAALAAGALAACDGPRGGESAQSAAAAPATPASQAATPAAAQPSGDTQLSAVVAANLPAMTVYKTPNCGCCRTWVERMQAAGFKVTVRDTMDVGPVKRQYGVADSLQTCHTAIVNGYVVEGHVPAEDVVRMLRERPAIAGIAVPGMPAGSPGMEMGDAKEPYEVIAFTKGGASSVYAKH